MSTTPILKHALHTPLHGAVSAPPFDSPMHEPEASSRRRKLSRQLSRRLTLVAEEGAHLLELLQTKRDKWTTKLDFLLAVTGFVVDLGNVWRFPYICYRNGGGAFLIPYMCMFFFGGLPLFYLELALGQYHKSGCISIWKYLCPIFKGIGIAICVVNSYMAFFYNTIISWSVYFLFSSFTTELPWIHCNNSWNTPNCTEPEKAALLNVTGIPPDERPNWVSPAQEFYERKVLEMQRSNGFAELGSVKWSLALCLFGVFLLVYFALWKGPRSAGKAVWITATMPYLVLTILLVRGLTLPGAANGIEFYLRPEWNRLKDSRVWIEAANQILFSLGPGFGVLLAFSSYNDFHNNFVKDAIITSAINSFTSFFSGFVIFSVLGYMAHTLQRDVADVAKDQGPGLVFVVYPQAIATMQGSTFWAIIFFFMLITLGLDSTFGGLESVVTALCDEFPNTLGKHRELFVLALVIYCFLGGLPTCTYGGMLLIDFFDHYGISITLLLTVTIEGIVVCWIYGITRFSEDVHQMLGFRPSFIWRWTWQFISPLFLTGIFIAAVWDLQPLRGYPEWSVAVGWMMRLSSLLWIPGYAVYHLYKQKGSFLERLKASITPEPVPKSVQRRSSSIIGRPDRDFVNTTLAQL